MAMEKTVEITMKSTHLNFSRHQIQQIHSPILFFGTCLNVTSVRVHQQRQPFSQTFYVFTIAEGAVAADARKGGKAAGKRGITLIFINKQHSWLKRTLYNFGVERSSTGISNSYAGYE